MKYFFIVILFLSGTLKGFSQTLSLKDAINTALKNSLDIQLSKNNVDANTILNNYGVAGGMPLVTAGGTDNEQVTSIAQEYSDPSRNAKKPNTASNNLNANLTGSILLFNGMRVVAAKKRLEQLQGQSEKLLNAQVQNTIASVMTAYYDVVRQQNYIKTIDLSINVAKQQLDIVKTRQSVGLANNADLFQAQLDLNNLEQTKNTQQLAIDQARTTLLTFMTVRPDSMVIVSDTIVADADLQLPFILDNLDKNADIMAAGDQVKINEQLVKEVSALRYPSLRANGGFAFSRNTSAGGFTLLNQSYGPTVGVGVTIPIYNGSVYKRQKQVAEINVNNAELQRKILVRDYTAGAVKAYQAYQTALQQIATAQKNFQLAQQLVDLVLLRFQLRQATIVELKQAQESFEAAAYTLTNLSYAAKSSEIELKRLANQLKF